MQIPSSTEGLWAENDFTLHLYQKQLLVLQQPHSHALQPGSKASPLGTGALNLPVRHNEVGHQKKHIFSLRGPREIRRVPEPSPRVLRPADGHSLQLGDDRDAWSGIGVLVTPPHHEHPPADGRRGCQGVGSFLDGQHLCRLVRPG